MKETKRVWKHFEYRECDAFAAYLEEMALQGWHLDHIQWGLVFRKGEPKKVRYEIEVFPKASDMDIIPAPDTEEFAEYCQQAGWEFVCIQQKFCIFRTEDPDVVPIETDEMQRFEQIKKGEHGHLWYDFYLLCGLSIANLISISRSLDNLFHNTMVTIGMIAIAYMILFLLRFFEVKSWEYATCKELKVLNNVIYKRRSRLLRIMDILPYIVALLIIYIVNIVTKNYMNLAIDTLYATLIFTIVILVSLLKPSRENNWIMQTVGGVLGAFIIIFIGYYGLSNLQMYKPTITIEELPLQLSDLRNDHSTTKEILIYDSAKGCLGSKEEYYLEASTGEILSYEIVKSPSNLILNLFWKEEINDEYRDYETSKDDAEKWDAVLFAKDMERGMHQYLIRYPKQLIRLGYDGEITPQIIQTVKEKLIDPTNRNEFLPNE